jgi:PAS domain S-box-containing protein
VPFRLIGEAERNDAGDIVRANGALQDVTDLVAATRRAQDAAQRLAQTLESMADAVYILDHDWVFTYLNQRAGDLLQRDPDELLGQVLWDAYPDTVGTVVEEAYRRAIDRNEPQSLEEFHYAPLGTWFAVDAYPTDQGLAVYFRDVTQAHETRAALERQAMLLDLAQDAIIVRDHGPSNHVLECQRGAHLRLVRQRGSRPGHSGTARPRPGCLRIGDDRAPHRGQLERRDHETHARRPGPDRRDPLDADRGRPFGPT